MRRSIVVSLLLLVSCHLSFGWGGVGHAAIAQVAENHISKSTKKILKKCLPGTNIVEVASDADENYYVWSRDIGFECTNSKILRRQPSDFDKYPTNIEPWCHSYSVDSLYNTYRHNREGDEYIRNAVMDLDQLITDLKANWTVMDKSECVMKLSLVIHLIGDIHCPMHVLYVPQAPTGGKYSFTVRGEKVNAHSYWDSKLIKMLEPEWSYYEYSEAAIHNVPEAAVYGCPVLFGPNNKKFKEAQDLIACKGSYEIHNEADFTDVLTKLLTYDELLRSSGSAAASYIRNNAGARDAIYKEICEVLK